MRIFRYVAVVVVAFVVASAASIVFTGHSPNRTTPPSSLPPLYSITEQVPVLAGLLLNGEPVVVDYVRSPLPIVLYFFVPFGEYDVANEDAIAEVVKGTRGRFLVYFVAASDKGLEPYIQRVTPGFGGAPVTVVRAVAKEMKRSLRVGGYPAMLVVSTSGRVQLEVQGEWSRNLSQRRAVQKFFGIRSDQPMGTGGASGSSLYP